MKRTPLAVLAVLAAASTALAAAPAAVAGPPSSTSSKTTGGQASAQWTEVDLGDALGFPGNTHVGYLGVYQQPGFTSVYGDVKDFQCEPGQSLPTGHGEPAGDTCALMGVRFLTADPGAVVFTSDTRTGTASLTGQLKVKNGGHGDGEVVGRPPADVRWTSVGGAYSFTRTDSWSDGTTSYSSRVRGTGFQADVSGRIGAMGFTDDADDVSDGSAENWREISRTRTRS